MAKRKSVPSGRKRRPKSIEQRSTTSDDSSANSRLSSNNNKSPSDWLTSINTDHATNIKNSEQNVEASVLLESHEYCSESESSTPGIHIGKSCKGEHENLSESLTDDEGTDESGMHQLPRNGLKPNKFYGSRLQSYKFSFQKSPKLQDERKMENVKLKNENKKGKSGSGKRKHAGQRDHVSNDHAVKKTKKDDQVTMKERVFSSSEKYHRINGACRSFDKSEISVTSERDGDLDPDIPVSNNVNCENTVLDLTTPESSSTLPMSEETLCSVTEENRNMNGHYNNMDSKINERTKEYLNPNSDTKTIIDEVVLELGSLHSEDSITSGLGSVKASSLLKRQNNEYYFSTSSESSPDLSISGPCTFIETPKSSTTVSPDTDAESGNSGENGIDRVGFLFHFKGASDSSYSPSCNSIETSSSSGMTPRISPEHQTSITSFFKTSTKQISTGTSPKNKKPERTKKNGKERKKKMEQMYLDLGQKDFGHVTCGTCGMVYTCAQPDDEIEHIRHHKKFVNGLRFNGWKDEHVVKEFHDGRIIMVKPDDHPSRLKKVEEIRKVVDSELGFAVDLPFRKNESKTFLFIANKKVVGCCVATQIDKGYPVLPSTPTKDSTPDRQIAAWCCSTVPVPAQCGISKIWVWNQYRRKKVATRLIDCVRSHFIYGCTIAKELLAFSDPTPDGKRLASTYVGTQEFLVFR